MRLSVASVEITISGWGYSASGDDVFGGYYGGSVMGGLLVAEGFHWFYLRGAAGGDAAGDEDYGCEDGDREE